MAPWETGGFFYLTSAEDMLYYKDKEDIWKKEKIE